MSSLKEKLIAYFGLGPLGLLERENAGKDVKDILSLGDEADPTACFSAPQDLDRAVNLFESEALSGNKTVVYGDYDVDGLTSVSIAYLTLKALGLKDIGFYIPSRYDTGYGLNLKILRLMAEKGYRFLIATDNGITKRKECDYLLAQGFDYLILDHHEEQKGSLPVFDPTHLMYHRNDCSAAFLALLVAFKVLQDQDFLAKLSAQGRKVASKAERIRLLNWIQILAGLAVFSDCMPLTEMHDLALAKRMNLILNDALDDLCDCPQAQRLTLLIDDWQPGKRVTYEDVNFQINSKLNAVARVWGGTKTNIGAFFLTSDDLSKVRAWALKIRQANQEKKEWVRKAAETAVILDDPCLQVLDFTAEGKGIPSGLSGLVANAALNKLSPKKAVLVLCPSGIKEADGRLSPDVIGSLRGPEGMALDKVLDSPFVKPFLKDHGGHEAACGFTLPLCLKDDFVSHMLDSLKDKPLPEKEEPFLIEESWVTPTDLKAVESLEPFGQGFKLPAFTLSVAKERLVRGLKGEHCFVELTTGARLVIFRAAEKLAKIPEGPVLVEGRMETDEFRGRKNLQFIGELPVV